MHEQKRNKRFSHECTSRGAASEYRFPCQFRGLCAAAGQLLHDDHKKTITEGKVFLRFVALFSPRALKLRSVCWLRTNVLNVFVAML